MLLNEHIFLGPMTAQVHCFKRFSVVANQPIFASPLKKIVREASGW